MLLLNIRSLLINLLYLSALPKKYVLQYRPDSISEGSPVKFDVSSNPEFLKEGAAISDFTNPDRIIIGADNEHVVSRFKQLYMPFNKKHDRLISMDIPSAELTKYAANAMLATKISFINEISNIAEKVGADIENVRIGIGSDNRIGYSFIYPGVGYGGSCFPKDIQALQCIAKENDYEPQLIGSVERVNTFQKQVLFDKLRHYFSNTLEGKKIALWGLSFKPNTDDMREAPSRYFMEACWNAGASVTAYDPEAQKEARRIYGKRDDLKIVKTKEEALKGADCLVLMTEWKNFKSPDFELIKKELSDAVIFDGRNQYIPEQLKEMGFTYYSIGRRVQSL